MFTIMGLFFLHPFAIVYSAFESYLEFTGLFFTAGGAFIAYLCFYPFAPNDNPHSRYTFQQMVKNDPCNKIVFYPPMVGMLLDGLACLFLWFISSCPATADLFLQIAS